MSFGKGKRHIQKNNVLSIPIGIDGIGEESHPTLSIIEKKVLDIVKGEVKIAEVKVKPSRLKLYLNTFINLLNNKEDKPNTKPTRQSRIAKIQGKLFRWWIKETTTDMKSLIWFVLIHGLLGAPVILALLTIAGLDMPLVIAIRGSIALSMVIYIIGSGSFYYLILDVNKALNETWSKRKK